MLTFHISFHSFDNYFHLRSPISRIPCKAIMLYQWLQHLFLSLTKPIMCLIPQIRCRQEESSSYRVQLQSVDNGSCNPGRSKWAWRWWLVGSRSCFWISRCRRSESSGLLLRRCHCLFGPRWSVLLVRPPPCRWGWRRLRFHFAGPARILRI